MDKHIITMGQRILGDDVILTFRNIEATGNFELTAVKGDKSAGLPLSREFVVEATNDDTIWRNAFNNLKDILDK